MARETDDAQTFIPTSVRLPSELRDELTREAAKNQRTLSHEIVKRLADSLTAAPFPKHVTQLRNEAVNAAPRAAEFHGTQHVSRANTHEATLLMLFAQLTPERQLALLTLLRGG